ncbi:SLBB domain-containing protein [Tunturiibacter gelidoferens]|uniref:Protein involved in polysaccharide export with SLBB domain n=1 Tax=Tunturiibacter gelidiferens TaxID=3069689 RepID=A0ACC5NW69_9BACT|nr:SLBB domain-containing protein [Edaphobacter lichenicola]MBB5338661.1 protein involved in polysaccharide export with SLBB domain [Edaphobacter lichenicola]
MKMNVEDGGFDSKFCRKPVKHVAGTDWRRIRVQEGRLQVFYMSFFELGRRRWFAIFFCCLLSSTSVWSQQLQAPTLPAGLPSGSPSLSPSPRTPNSNPTDDDSAGRTRLSAEGDNTSQGTNGVLTTDQVLKVLQSRPELIVDIKEVMADYLQQQGTTTQSDAITDDMLYKGISTDTGLRAVITVWLRARGYLSGSDLDRQSSDMQEFDESLNPTTSLGSGGPDSLRGGVKDANSPGFDRPDNVSSDVVRKKGGSGSSERGDLSPPIKSDRNSGNSTEVIHQTTPYNLQSLRDLYSQIPEQTSKLRRFGSDMFLERGLTAKQMSIDVPVGPEYILGAGDGLIISLWGGVSQTFPRNIDREGTIVLPDVGAVLVAGLPLGRAQELIQQELGKQFRDAKVSVTLSRLRTIRVYIVGDVQRPGAYDLSSLATPLNALYAAGGPTNLGSLRIARQYRGKELVREVDLYDFLLHGVRPDGERLEAGDTILIPPVGRQVAVAGMVKRPAIYELRGERELSEVLDEAGGLLVAAAMSRITIERIDEQGHRATLNLDIPEGSTREASQIRIEQFAVLDGDRVNINPILPYSEKAIYVEGHVVRPGKFPYHDGMKLNDVLRSYQDLLPEPADRGEIVRLMPPDLRVEAISFSVPDVFVGNEEFDLRPFDTIRIAGRYEADAPKVQVHGEVIHPGEYALSQGMTAAQLVRMAGGFKRSALLDAADLASYDVKDGRQVISRRGAIRIGAAVNNYDSASDVILKAGDVLTIHQISGWNDIGSSVSVSGEVAYPGSYGLQEGERLSSVLKRAGGFRSSAYPSGAVLIRLQVKELEDKSRNELIHQIETTSAGARLAPSLSAQDDAATLQLLVQQQKEVVSRLRNQPAIGRLVIKINRDISSWEGTSADVELRNGDVLTIPKRPGFVLVTGQVYNASAITFVPGKTTGWYLQRAGGSTEGGNRKEILVIRANGLVVGRRSNNWHEPGVLDTKLDPGDVVVVPQKVFGGSALWRNLFASAQVFSSVGFAAALALH